jgi:hypothetical protein
LEKLKRKKKKSKKENRGKKGGKMIFGVVARGGNLGWRAGV